MLHAFSGWGPTVDSFQSKRLPALNQILENTTTWKVKNQPAAWVQRLICPLAGFEISTHSASAVPLMAPQRRKLRCAPCHNPPSNITNNTFAAVAVFFCMAGAMSMAATRRSPVPERMSQPPSASQRMPSMAHASRTNKMVAHENLRLPPKGMYT